MIEKTLTAGKDKRNTSHGDRVRGNRNKKVIELQYESRFDGFLIDLRIGAAEDVNDAMFGGEPVFTYERGATVSAALLPAETYGCLVWLEKFDGSPESIATLFHELVHVSALRFEKSGVFRRSPKPKDVRRGLVAFDELMANSVNELGAAFLTMLSEQKKISMINV